MKKLSLLVGTIGGAFAGYVFSKSELRDELTNAKDAESVAKILGKHLSKDGQKIGKEVMAFVESPEVQKNLKAAQKYVTENAVKAQKELTKMMAKPKVQKALPAPKKQGAVAKKAAKKAKK